MTPSTLQALRAIAAEIGDTASVEAIDKELLASAQGALVFQLVLALGTDAKKAQKEKRVVPAWAPTLNEYNGMKGWQKAVMREGIDREVMNTLPAWPSARLPFREVATIKKGKIAISRVWAEERRRIVRVTRESSRKPDEISCDVLGGKAPIDRLVIAGVLRGDSETWLERRAEWKPAPTGKGRVVVDVFELP